MGGEDGIHKAAFHRLRLPTCPPPQTWLFSLPVTKSASVCSLLIVTASFILATLVSFRNCGEQSPDHDGVSTANNGVWEV